MKPTLKEFVSETIMAILEWCERKHSRIRVEKVNPPLSTMRRLRFQTAWVHDRRRWGACPEDRI